MNPQIVQSYLHPHRQRLTHDESNECPSDCEYVEECIKFIV